MTCHHLLKQRHAMRLCHQRGRIRVRQAPLLAPVIRGLLAQSYLPSALQLDDRVLLLPTLISEGDQAGGLALVRVLSALLLEALRVAPPLHLAPQAEAAPHAL